MITRAHIDEFVSATRSANPADLVRAALIIPYIEQLTVDREATLAELKRLGQRAGERLAKLGTEAGREDRVAVLNELLFDEEGFSGNETRYDDPRNSFLDVVIERRTGIPITLCVVYLEVAARAGFGLIDGVNFPGHFLVRAPTAPSRFWEDDDLLIDPYHRGALLSRHDCEKLLERQIGSETPLTQDMLAIAGKRDIVIRMLTNLKRLYVRFRSFPQARDVTNLLLELDPVQAVERRDRGLLSYQMHDYRRALIDLEAYLQQLAPVPTNVDEEFRQEYEQIWDHVKTLRRRLASFN
jgi:regulator of sirC expression with transglutaminase-like and TPR domain